MRCPRCKSENTVKWKSRWACKACEYTWIKGKKNTYKGKVECPDCRSLKVRKHDKSIYTGKRRWLCNECGAAWTEGTHIKIRPEERKEWIKWIKQEYKEHKDIKRIREYIKETVHLSDRSINYLIQQAIGKRKKEIPYEVIEKALHFRKQGVKWKDIERLVGFSWKAVYNKAKYVYKLEV